MAVTTRLTGTKFRWDRNWVFYQVRATLAEDHARDPWPTKTQDEIANHDKDKMTGWNGHIVELLTPILLDTSVIDIITTPTARIYPPFRLNKKSSITSLFDDVRVPVGSTKTTGNTPIPTHAVKGILTELASKDTFVANGLRVDTKSGVRLDELLEFLLISIRQYTMQWWVASPRNPFDIGLRINFELRKDFHPKDILKAKGRGTIESSWYGSAATQNFIGIESPLTGSSWGQIADCVKAQRGLEPALQFYLDALDLFMGYRDSQCILNLALVFEVCENKSLLMDGQSAKSKNKDLLRNPTIAPKERLEIFRKLITDRDNIAHGRAPHHFKKDALMLVHYLEATTELVKLYVAKCHKYGWSKATQLSL